MEIILSTKKSLSKREVRAMSAPIGNLKSVVGAKMLLRNAIVGKDGDDEIAVLFVGENDETVVAYEGTSAIVINSIKSLIGSGEDFKEPFNIVVTGDISRNERNYVGIGLL